MGASSKVRVKMVPNDYLRVENSSNGIITNTLNKKWSFPLKISFSKCDQIRTEEILNGKLRFLCSDTRYLHRFTWSNIDKLLINSKLSGIAEKIT